ncbi:MAG: DUF4364 family protein [Ruminococcaceae bacterium]|nr:DUF4364 family protein [Oscillospiraceae bacterium]
MKKAKKFSLKTTTDIKVFILFLLDSIGYPIDHDAVIGMVSENSEQLIMDYDECLGELVDDGHLLYDEYNGEKFYMISDSGRMIASQLYDSLDGEFRERSLRYAAKYTSLSKSGTAIKATVIDAPGNRFKVTLQATDGIGEILCASITVNSRSEAEKIKSNFEARPDAVYRGMLFSATGRLEFLS